MTQIRALNNGCCGSETVSQAGNWVSAKAQVLTKSAGEFFTRVKEAIGNAFAWLGLMLSQLKDAVLVGWEQLKAMPKEAKILGGIFVALSAIVTALFCNCFGTKVKEKEKTEETKIEKSEAEESEEVNNTNETQETQETNED